MLHNPKLGQRVAMATHFLRSIHDFSRASADQRGHITHISAVTNDRQLVQVQWDDGHVSKSLNSNLQAAACSGMTTQACNPHDLATAGRRNR